jgi:hypothetical protein
MDVTSGAGTTYSFGSPQLWCWPMFRFLCIDHCLSFCSLSFVHCIVLRLIGIFKPFLLLGLQSNLVVVALIPSYQPS